MDNKTLSILKECIAQDDAAAWLDAHPEHREILEPFIDLDGKIRTSAQISCASSEPSPAAIGVGRSRLMHEVKSRSSAGPARPTSSRGWRSGPIRAGAMAALATAAIVVLGGTSASVGVGGLGQAVLDAVSGPTEDEHEDGINNAPPAAENGVEQADDNAQEGSLNSEQGPLNGNGANNQGGGCAPTEDGSPAEVNENSGKPCENDPPFEESAGENPGAGGANGGPDAEGSETPQPTKTPKPDDREKDKPGD